jgi:hypothetical protein
VDHIKHHYSYQGIAGALLVLWAHFYVDADSFVWYPRVERHPFEVAFNLYCFLEFCRGLLLGQRCLLMLLSVFPQEMHVFVAQSETTLDISGFLLTTEYCFYVEGG